MKFDPSPSLVKLFSTSSSPDYSTPWHGTSPPEVSVGSGLALYLSAEVPIVILTAAHVIVHALHVVGTPLGSTRRIPLRILAVAHDADLALLVPATASSARAFRPLPWRQATHKAPLVPDLQAAVQVLGFPIGGEYISITRGVVSRREVQEYTHSRRRLFALTVDSAINPGNSGGPAFSGDGRHFMGVAFQGVDSSEAELIGHLVPLVVVQHFLRGLHKGDAFNRFPGLGIDVAPLQNDYLRAYSGMDSVSLDTVRSLLHEAGESAGDVATETSTEPSTEPSTPAAKTAARRVRRARHPRGSSSQQGRGVLVRSTGKHSPPAARKKHSGAVVMGTDVASVEEDAVSGVRVTRVWAENSCAGLLRPGDLLVGVCGHAIANDGTVVYRGGCRADLEVWIHEHYVLDKVSLTIVRDGVPRNLQVVLRPLAQLVPRAPYYDTPPRFFVYGGLVLQPVSLGLLESLQALGSADAVVAITQGIIDEHRTEEIMLTQVLSDDVNAGYESESDNLVRTVNGKPCRNLSDLIRRVEATPRGSLVTLGLSNSNLIALPSPADLADDTQRINRLYNVTIDRRVDGEPGVVSPRAVIVGHTAESASEWLKDAIRRVQQ